jgi:hypothetical protein
LLLLAAALCGCVTTASTGPSLSELARSVGPPKAGQARIVVFRDKGVGGLVGGVGWDVNLDGQPMGSVKFGTFVYRDRPGGRHQLELLFDPFPRPSRHAFDAVPGRTYVFRMELNDRGKTLHASGAVAGLAGFLVAGAISAASDDRGSYDFVPVDSAALADIGLAE